MDREPIEFLLGDREGAHLLLRTTGRDRGHGPDEGWLIAGVEIAAGGFSGGFRAFFRPEELATFRDQLIALYDRLSGEAVLDTAEGWLRVAVRGDGRGGLVARGEATDDPAIGNRLHFVLLLDQTYLPGMIASLGAILDLAPVAS